MNSRCLGRPIQQDPLTPISPFWCLCYSWPIALKASSLGKQHHEHWLSMVLKPKPFGSPSCFSSDRATTKWPFYSLLLSDYIRPSNFPHDPHWFPCFRDWENPTFSQDSKPAKGPQAAKTTKPVKKELRAWCKTYIYHREVFCLLWETLHVPYATHEWESFCWRQQATTEPTTRDRLKTNLKAVNNGSSPLQRTVSPLGLKS